MTPAERPMLIDAHVDERKGRLIVEVRDEIISTTVPELRRNMVQVYDQEGFDSWKSLYLDIRTARMVDSMGVNWLFAESVRLREHKKTMVLRVSSPAIFRVIQFAGLDKLVVVKFRRRKQTR
ncbi:MAG TPA: STAS domain-containing protein [Oceanipulchritudo sp.]|nr:STAS domain-containing protein [Oceanipulchritudo sp.]